MTACNGTEMNQGGLKHAATESRLDNKRERRRGASGRAAVLRRAPSDSDCSGETASLSADSGERAVRPPPPPTRATKSRSRRRGSEWEVLEGLKDGQRFEKRPDVFNGYLHKKRKWPLKGWHKRFFVVDGGILVYTRSPTDVARGRLHGSVDVGLSVISAKARRRRIDIDADEFIYHLRAKTADVFRTWLNVLKAHRLYRQHLLTFGTRESVPKIHAPLDDLPPTDTSSRTSRLNIKSSYLSSNEDIHNPIYSYNFLNKSVQQVGPKCEDSKVESLCNWHVDTKIKNDLQKGLCPVNCVGESKLDNVLENYHIDDKDGSRNEKQMNVTDLGTNEVFSKVRLPSTKVLSSVTNLQESANDKKSLIQANKTETRMYFLFKQRKRSQTETFEFPMRKSRKATNLVKYKNLCGEPPLKDPLRKCLLMYSEIRPAKENVKKCNKGVICDPFTIQDVKEQPVYVKAEHKSLQDIMTSSEFDNITELLMVTMLQNHISHQSKSTDIKHYISRLVRELYHIQYSQNDVHPDKVLLRSLLEYWLKNTTGKQFSEAAKRVKSVNVPSNRFTEDKILSGQFITNSTKQTQFYGIYKPETDIMNLSEVNNFTSTPKDEETFQSNIKGIRCYSPKRDTESFEKEREVQEFERLLKNTVYVYDTARNSQSREKDIRMTKRLIDNLDKLSKTSDFNLPEFSDLSNSSTELPKIQGTITHLISDTALSVNVAKDFLHAYLEVLIDNSSRSGTDNCATSTGQFETQIDTPVGDAQTESLLMTTSKCVMTVESEDDSNQHDLTMKNKIKKPTTELDAGQQFLKDMLDKMCPSNTNDARSHKEESGVIKKETAKYVSRFINYRGKNLINQHFDDNSLVIDLSNHNLEHISTYSDSTSVGTISVTMKLREKVSNVKERIKSNIKYCNQKHRVNRSCSPNRLEDIDSGSLRETYDPFHKSSSQVDLEDNLELKPFTDSTDNISQLSSAIVHESEHSIDMSFNSSQFYKNDSLCNELDDAQCYILSSIKKKNLSTKHLNKDSLQSPSKLGCSKFIDEYAVFEQSPPKVIDEKFILLLLENLTLLCENLPTMHKDIKAIYLKLKKKHEKAVKDCCSIQGLSLLGKMYNEDKRPNNKESQYEDNLNNNLPVTSDVTLTTSQRDIIKKIGDDECICVDKPVISKGQTDAIAPKMEPNSQDDNGDSFVIFSSPKSALLPTCVDCATSTPNWRKLTKEYAVDASVQTVSYKPHYVRTRCITCSKIFANIPILKPDKGYLYRKNSDKSVLSTCPDSSHSPTEGRGLNNEFYVHQLFKTYSMMDNTYINWSDDVRTVYCCSDASDASLSSGLVSPTGPPLRGPQAGFVSGTPGGRLASWIIESGGPLENASRELGQAQLSVQQLQRLLEALELQQQVHHDTDVPLLSTVQLDML